MARVTEDEVKAIFPYPDNADLTPFIDSAHLVVEGTLGSEGLSEDLLKEIERWLSAHFASARYSVNSKEKVGDVDVTKQGKWGMGLDSTDYGQKVKLLDPTGKLDELDDIKKQIYFEVI